MLKRAAALLTIAFFFLTAVRAGWSQLETDFPNYYTAAVALRHHQPLQNYYDWSWFARQMNYAGIERGTGAYTPQTPLTMLPMVPLTSAPPLAAKRIWLILNLAFLAITIWLLSRVTRFKPVDTWLLAFCGYFSLSMNCLYGQYYVFLLFLLTLGYYYLYRQSLLPAGSLTGAAFALKLYGGPFLLYFAAKRQWKAVLAMAAATLLLVALALALFGWSDIHYYASQVLPRTLEGGSIDPYNPGVPSFSTLLRHLFMREPELNPVPLRQAPWLFFFLRTLVTVAVVAFTTAGVARSGPDHRRDFAWFMIAVVMLSTSIASYTFIVLLLPTVLLLDDAGPRGRVCVFALYFLLAFRLPMTWLFPKLWLIVAFYFVAGWTLLRRIPARWTVAMAALAVVVAAVDAGRHMSQYAQEPGQHYARVGAERGAIYSSFPVMTQAGVFYQSMGADRYVLGWLHGGEHEKLAFAGHVLHPRAAADGRSVDFELVAGGTSKMMRFDPSTRQLIASLLSVPPEAPVFAVSPDERWTAYESDQNGPTQIWLRDQRTGAARLLTGGNCNSTDPSWEPDSKAILFASDCERAYGLPALYRIELKSNDR